MAKDKERLPDIRIYSVSPSLKEDLENISKNLGHSTFNGFIKAKLREIRNSYPETMRQKPKEY